MNIAFRILGQAGWTAEQVYIQNLLVALRKTFGKGMGLYLLLPQRTPDPPQAPVGMEADGVIPYPLPPRGSLPWLLAGLSKRLLGRHLWAERMLRQGGIDVVFGAELFDRYQGVATIAWLPDFQHLHLPEMFGPQELRARERVFRLCLTFASRILLMSEAARRDLERFAPQYTSKARVLHAVTPIPPSIYETDPRPLLARYSLPEKFVYLPNQFWKHKNHETAFRAVRRLKEEGTLVTLVCTGSPVDYRHPRHFEELFQKVAQWGLQEQILYLGLVPREHVLLLMRQSVCVLNPSRFEGWGMAVEEARSLGKRLLLSDIPAHREQNPPQALFFSPDDEEDLAEKLRLVWESTPPGPHEELEQAARETLPQRLRTFAQGFLALAQEALRNSLHPPT